MRHTKGQIPVITEEFGGETIDGSKNLFCSYRLEWACVGVYVVDFGAYAPVDLENLEAGAIAEEATPAPLTLQGGRLIVYSYYVPGV